MSDNKEAEKYFNEGMAELERGAYESAIAKFTEAIKINPNLAAAYNNRGLAKSKLRQYTEAIADYNKALEIDPDDPGVYSNRGVAKTHLEQYDSAMADFNKALEIDPKHANAYNNRGFLKGRLKQYDEAIEDYNEALKINPYLAETYDNLGNVKIEKKDYKGAIEDYNEALKINSNYVKAYSSRGNAKWYLNQYREATKDYDRALEINPEYAEAYNNRIEVQSLLSFQEGKLIPEYLYIPLLKNTSYGWGVWLGVCIAAFFLLLCGLNDKTLLDIMPMEVLFMLIGFFLVAIELGQKNESVDEDNVKPTFEILLISFIVGVGIFIFDYIIIEIFYNEYFTILAGNVLGLLYITLLYVLMNRMRTVFIKIDGQSGSTVKLDADKEIIRKTVAKTIREERKNSMSGIEKFK